MERLASPASHAFSAALKNRPQRRSMSSVRKISSAQMRAARALIRWTLVQVLQRAMQSRLQFADIRYLAGLRQALTDSATERLDLARHMDRAAQGA